MALVQLWWDIARDETRRDSDRLEASRLLAERGWGKAPTFAAIEEGDPLDLADAEKAAEEFTPRSFGSRAIRSRTGGKLGSESPGRDTPPLCEPFAQTLPCLSGCRAMCTPPCTHGLRVIISLQGFSSPAGLIAFGLGHADVALGRVPG
jgi:hypothetical protein